MSGTLLSNENNIQSMIPDDQIKYNNTMMQYGAIFYMFKFTYTSITVYLKKETDFKYYMYVIVRTFDAWK